MIVELFLPRRLLEPTLYRLCEPLRLAGVKVPEGFVTDGASVPRLLWWLFPPTGRYFTAAVVHDWLLERGTPWKEANRIFYRALKEQGVPGWVSGLMFAAVTVHGWRRQLEKWLTARF